MKEKEDLINLKKTELKVAQEKLNRSRSDSDLVRVISLACEVAGMLQDMYVSVRDKNSELEDEVKQLKSVINTLTT
jgi:hypothetical protein